MNLIPSFTAALARSPVFLSSFLALWLTGASSSLSVAAAPSSQEIAHLDSKTASELIIHFVSPEYPPVAKVNYIQGRVKIEIEVDRQGAVAEAHIIKGDPLLAAAAIEAVREWRYRPLVSSTGPAPFLTDVSISFNLNVRKLKELPGNPEKYLQKQVQPPKVVAGPGEELSSPTVELKVLVGANGQVLDSTPLSTGNGYVRAARQKVRGWKFRAARWGTIAIPWYLVVKVPIGRILTHGKAKNSDIP